MQYSAVLQCPVQYCTVVLAGNRGLGRGQVRLGRTLDAASLRVELRPVAGAVEGLVDGVPLHCALEMRAHSCTPKAKHSTA